MELLLTVSFVIGVFVLLACWVAAVVIIKHDAFSDSRPVHEPADVAVARAAQDEAPRELASAQVS